MNLGRARSLSLILTLMSCSTDTLVVATLDGSAGEGGEPSAPRGGGVGGSELGGAGGVDVGGTSSESGGTPSAGSGGTGPVTELVGEPTKSVCACVGSASFVCSADGVTYDASCTDGCDRVVIACLHACPCIDAAGDGGAASSTDWVDSSCFDPSVCPSGWLCFTTDGTQTASSCNP